MPWPDDKIRAIALRHISRSSMDAGEWRFTRLGTWDRRIDLDVEPGELPLVTIYIAPSSWSVFTTRRIVGQFDGVAVGISPLDVVQESWGADPKGVASGPTAVMTLETRDGRLSRLEFETGKAWMGPVQAMRFWRIKYPILDNLDV